MKRLSHCTVNLLLAILCIIMAGCDSSNRNEMSDNDKLQRIDEMVAGYQAKYPHVPGIDPATLRQKLEQDSIVLVDVRSDDERATSMIPGAISGGEFERRSEDLEGASVVTYCTIGYRSAAYAQELRSKGWDASNLDGSILAWTHADGALIDPQGEPTRRVHVYGKRWNLAADDYDAVW